MKVTSAARKWAMPVYIVVVLVLGVLVPFVFEITNGAFIAVIVLAVAIAIFFSRMLPWGYELDGTKVSVTRPYASKHDVIFDLSEVTQANYISINFVKRVDLRFADGTGTALLLSGTQNPAPFVEVVVGSYRTRVAAEAEQAKQGTSV